MRQLVAHTASWSYIACTTNYKSKLMSNRLKARKRFWRSTGLLFIVYAIIIPVVFFILDQETFLRLFRKEPVLFPLELAGAAFGISLIITTWTHRDPELQKW